MNHPVNSGFASNPASIYADAPSGKEQSHYMSVQKPVIEEKITRFSQRPKTGTKSFLKESKEKILISDQADQQPEAVTACQSKLGNFS
mmetsp:Transcript_11936/g.18423  ORF Transcript_11936/g.18423 Transcript_11936/m.18423 type:complete len:88 (+) Transcript_11936:85-348(+)